MVKFEKDVWVFLCPVHGEESSLLCFEAWDEKNASRWRKIHVVSTEIKTGLQEREKYQKDLAKRMSTWMY